jgi:hypothetical protein
MIATRGDHRQRRETHPDHLWRRTEQPDATANIDRHDTRVHAGGRRAMGRRHIRPEPQIAADTTMDTDTSLAMYAGHQPSRRAIVAEAADGQSADRSTRVGLAVAAPTSGYRPDDRFL